MDFSTKIERYKELFNDDPLYIDITRRGLLEELFEPCYFYERIFFDSTYSTKQAGELLDIKGREQTLLNFLNRNDFKEYIQIHRQGSRGYYRYDYKNLFQFKMILLLSNHELMPSDIASIVGTRSPEYSENAYYPNRNNLKSLPPEQDYEALIESIVEEKVNQVVLAFSNLIAEKDMKLKSERLVGDVLAAQRELDHWESEMNTLVDAISGAELNIKMHRMLLEKLRNPQKKSMLTKLFGPKPDPLLEDEYEKRLIEYKELHEKLLARKKQLDENKEGLLTNKNKASIALEELKESQSSLQRKPQTTIQTKENGG